MLGVANFVFGLPFEYHHHDNHHHLQPHRLSGCNKPTTPSNHDDYNTNHKQLPHTTSQPNSQLTRVLFGMVEVNGENGTVFCIGRLNNRFYFTVAVFAGHAYIVEVLYFVGHVYETFVKAGVAALHPRWLLP